MPTHLKGANKLYTNMAVPISRSTSNMSKEGRTTKNTTSIHVSELINRGNQSSFFEDEVFFNATEENFTINMSLLDNYGMNVTGFNDGISGSSTAMNILLFLILISCCYLSKPNVPDASQRHGLIWRENQRRREERKKDPERRKRFIEHSLVKKRVIACDKDKALQLDDGSGSISMSGSFSIDSLEDENVSACVICLDPFQKGDYVTWAKSMECRHVFHQECLEGWLANPKNDDCPYCRCQIIDDVGDGDGPEEAEEDQSSSLAYVIMNGLISPLRRASLTLIGSSINLDDVENGCHNNDKMKRTLSFGSADMGGIVRSSSQIGLALRRVSSNISSHLRGSFDSLDDSNNSQRCQIKVKEPPELRRTYSEGLYTVTRSRTARRGLDRNNYSFDSFDEQDALPLSPDSLVPDDFTSHCEDKGDKGGGGQNKIYDTAAKCIQTLSEGIHATPRTRNYERLESENSDNTSVDDKLQIDLELRQNDDVHRNFPTPRLSFAFNRSNVAYTKLTSNDVQTADFVSDDLSDEDSLRSFTVSRDDDDNKDSIV